MIYQDIMMIFELNNDELLNGLKSTYFEYEIYPQNYKDYISN